jgi:maleylpyruvate isomerase
VNHDLEQQIGRVRDASGRLRASLAGLTDADVGAGTLCAGWTVGHVLTHVARNADGFRRSAAGARDGAPIAPYDSRAARDADIEAGADRPAADILADVATSATLLDETWSGLGDAAWATPMPHHSRDDCTVADAVVMRWSELEIHHVDLGRGFTQADWSAEFLDFLLGPELERLPAGVADRVSGPRWALAAWLVGRPVAGALEGAAELPDPGPWGSARTVRR